MTRRELKKIIINNYNDKHFNETVITSAIITFVEIIIGCSLVLTQKPIESIILLYAAAPYLINILRNKIQKFIYIKIKTKKYNILTKEYEKVKEEQEKNKVKNTDLEFIEINEEELVSNQTYTEEEMKEYDEIYHTYCLKKELSKKIR